MGLFDKNSSSTTNNNERNSQSTNEAIVENSAGAYVGGSISLSGDGNSITDGGAIAGNISVANNALKTAETITSGVGDKFNTGLQSVNSLAGTFAKSLETLKKTELTDGKSLITDLLKWWPILPVAGVAVFVFYNRSKKNG